LNTKGVPTMENINDNTITVAIDLQGGLCDRLMLGIQGIINNANASIECWKFNSPTDEDLKELNKLQSPKDLENALEVLKTDNFHVEIVSNIEQLKSLLQDDNLCLDLENIKFENNLYTIY
jgi:hypothetical protein